MAFIQVVSLFLSILFTNISDTSPKPEISTVQFNIPVLVGKAFNPVLRICIDNDNPDAILEAIGLDKAGSRVSDLKNIRVFFGARDSVFRSKNEFGARKEHLNDLNFRARQPLVLGKNYLWVSVELSDQCNLLGNLEIELTQLSINGEVFQNIPNPGRKLRTGVAVRDHGQDGVHTYRIPGLETSNKGTLMAIYDVRREYGRDLQGHMDIGLSRSTDGGQHWENMQIVLDMGEFGGLPEKFNGVSDACILIDRNSDAIYIAGLWMHGVINEEGQWQEGLTESSRDWNHQWRNKGSQPGLEPRQTSQFLITKSVDDGLTWSKPVNLTKMCKDPAWWLWAPAPGHGICLKDGTLVFPTQGRDKRGLPFSNITYSQDGGETWKTSNPASRNTTESMVVELSDGSLMSNIRDNRNRDEKGSQNGRAVSVTKDLGETWVRHSSSNKALIEPVCMASIHRHDYRDKDGVPQSILLFSNPNSKFKRHRQTIKVSFDEGLTWPEAYWIELDEWQGAGYSCLTTIDEQTIGILYEGSQAQMTFQKLTLKEILRQ